ncbi:FAD-binding oxidoreductase [Maribacter algarum]|uniref:FAD-binding oxidoreductase n=1 Tax=Maribacter algarum (ex Zhang et al. 2020) TaxID=2578118 RepID=A0A5S3PWV9_9FLAO|nr:FAD-binding oxidoreductase [Maribacter algarum]TMM59516.1 FAD-binding oxidoreductase [Maribacter algarum]
MLDYLVVGLGLAGVSFCERLEQSGKTFKVISDTSQTSSIVAGGLYNPVILKRFTMAWNAKEQLDMAIPFYKSLEKKLGVTLDYQVPVLRRFASIEEQNLWFEVSDKIGLRHYLSPEILKNKNPNIDAPFGLGEVLHTGRIDTKLLLSSYSNFLLSKDLLFEDTFDHATLHIASEKISYKSIQAKQIVFAEGFGLKKNPYFSYLPLTSTKGEYLTIKAPDLKETNTIKSSIFLIPWKDDLYRVGATYKWKDTTNLPTEASKIELLQKLDAFLKCDYQIVGQLAGIRPTVTDRRPLVGKHPKYENLYVLNGFGSRGVMIAPFASDHLLNLIEKGKAVYPEMDIYRFTKKHFKN